MNETVVKNEADKNWKNEMPQRDGRGLGQRQRTDELGKCRGAGGRVKVKEETT